MNQILEVEHQSDYLKGIYKNKVTPKYEPKKEVQRDNEFAKYLKQKGYNEGQRAVIKKVYHIHATEDDPKYQYVKGIVKPNRYEVLKQYVYDIESDKNRKGNSIPYSKSRKVKDFLNVNVKGKSREEMLRLYEVFGVSRKVW